MPKVKSEAILSEQKIEARTVGLYEYARQDVFRRTDRLLARLATLQFLALVALALWAAQSGGPIFREDSPLVVALLAGALTALPVVVCTHYLPGRRVTRYTAASCQVLMGVLLVHFSGGGFQTHFHIFGSLALLSLYRDWRVFVPATSLVVLVQIGRGLTSIGNTEWMGFAAWVFFCDYFLIKSVLQQEKEIWDNAEHQAALEYTSEIVEQQVVELLTERKRFEDAFRFAPVGMALVNCGDVTISKVNDELVNILGCPAPQLLGCSLEQFSELGEGSPEILAMEARQPDIECEVHYLRHDGSLARVVFRATLQLSHYTDIADSYIVQVLDITERLEAERQIREREQMQLHSQKLESLGVLAGGIAHELNSPIQFIGDNLGFLQEAFQDMEAILAPLKDSSCSTELSGLQAKALDLELADLLVEVPGAIRESIEGVERVGNIVSSMRDYAHPGGEMKEVDLNEVLKTASTVARNELKYVAETTMNLEPALKTVLGNQGELMQAFLNILINAAHAIQDKGEERGKSRISLATRNLAGQVEVEVEDSGTGIPREYITKIFDPFFTTKEVGRGTGQGLAITNTIVKNHSGSLTVESEPGKGSTFRFRFPVATSLTGFAS